MASSGILRLRAGEPQFDNALRRFTDSRSHEPMADAIYRAAFQSLGIPLAEGTGVWYEGPAKVLDQALGIDAILRTQCGAIATLQEKFLFVERSKLPHGEPTVTVEMMDGVGNARQGDWYKLACQYLFVGYDYGYTDQRAPGFTDWMLLDWAALVRARLPWRPMQNKREGVTCTFQYVTFSSIPAACVIRSKAAYITGGMWSLPFLSSGG